MKICQENGQTQGAEFCIHFAFDAEPMAGLLAH